MSDYFSDGHRCCWYEENKISFQSFTELILVLFMYFSINGIQNHITVIMWSCNFLIFKKNIILEKLRVNISYVFFLSHFSTFITYSTFKGRGVPRMWSLTTMVYTGYKINLVLYLCEHIHFHFSFSCIGEGNENPLQCSCLENPRDGGAWWAAVYGSHRIGHDWSDLAAAAAAAAARVCSVGDNGWWKGD